MEQIYDIIILGGGPAGYTCAMYASRAGLDTLVVEKLSAGGQMALTDIIDNYPGFDSGINGFDLGIKMQQGAERFGAKTEYAEVLSVDLSEEIKKVETSNGELLTKTLVIATGADPKCLGLKNEASLIGKGVHYCAHCDGGFYRGKTVIVAGGGNTAVSDALYLSKIAKKVYLVHRRDTFRATKIYCDAVEKTENIEILKNSRITDFMADGRLTGAYIEDIRSGEVSETECDGIFISIGRNPATEFLKGALALDEYGYIIADENTETDIPGVFAIGDVRTKALRQIITAASDGAVAAFFAEKYLSSK